MGEECGVVKVRDYTGRCRVNTDWSQAPYSARFVTIGWGPINLLNPIHARSRWIRTEIQAISRFTPFHILRGVGCFLKVYMASATNLLQVLLRNLHSYHF